MILEPTLAHLLMQRNNVGVAARRNLASLVASPTVAITEIGRTATAPGNHAGRLPIQSLTDAASGASAITVTKGIQGRAEVAASDLAPIVGISHRVPAAVPLGDDGVRMMFAAGISASDASVMNADELFRTVLAGIERDLPGLEPAMQSRLAALEVDLARVFDYLIGNSDRRPRNLIVDTAERSFALIDNASIGHGDFAARKILRPMLRADYQGANGHTELGADAVAWFRQHLTDEALTNWYNAHDGLRPLTLEALLARANQVREAGAFDYADGATMFKNTQMFSKVYAK